MIRDIEIHRNNQEATPNRVKANFIHSTPQRRAILAPPFLGDRLQTRSPADSKRLKQLNSSLLQSQNMIEHHQHFPRHSATASSSDSNAVGTSQPHPENPEPAPLTDDRLPLELLRSTRPRQQTAHQNGLTHENGIVHTGMRSTSPSPPSTRQASAQPNLSVRYSHQRSQLQKRSSRKYPS